MSENSSFGPAPDAVDAPGADGFTISSLVFALPGFIPLGVVFGIIGLLRIQRTGRPGRGMAISALVISSLWLLGGIVVLIPRIMAPTSQPALGHLQPAATRTTEPTIPTETPRDVTDYDSVFYVSVDNCYDLAPDPEHVKEVDCDAAHDEQVFGTISLSGASYPGNSVKDQVRDGCRKQVSTYFTSGEPKADLSAKFYSPSEGNWNDGVRYGLCSFKKASGKLTGRVAH